MGVLGLEVTSDQEEGGSRPSFPAWRALDGDALTEKSDTQEAMHKNASQLSPMLDLVTVTWHIVHACRAAAGYWCEEGVQTWCLSVKKLSCVSEAFPDQWWERRALKQWWGFCHLEQRGPHARWELRLSHLQPSHPYEDVGTSIRIHRTALAHCISPYMESCKQSHQIMWAQPFSTTSFSWRTELRNTGIWAMQTLSGVYGEWVKQDEQASLTL